MDQRWQSLGHLLVHHSMQVQPNEKVLITMREAHTLPLVRAVYEDCIRADAYPQVQFLSDTLDHSLLRYGTPQQIERLPDLEALGMEWADVNFALRGTHNLYEFSDIPNAVLASYRKTMGKVSSLRWEKTRWSIVRVPNEDFAQQAETDYETILDMFFDGCLRDWPTEAQRWQAIADRLNAGTQVHVVAPGTDLRFSTQNRKWLVADGRNNLPDGEIFTAPDHTTVDGVISFEWPGVLGGRLVPGLRLEWKQGKLINASASQNEDFLQTILASDEGATAIGEFAFGVNYGINRFCKDIFFDEKIGGTIHIALGRAYPLCGGTNQSAIHWDIIKDLRQAGAVYLDGRKVFENGAFI